ncbi:hypothetical protein FNI44_19025 [Salmonella enterica subsp. salamae]|nr:hypothetical protein [Salmonella enterica subsp. salamae serovar Sofia]
MQNQVYALCLMFFSAAIPAPLGGGLQSGNQYCTSLKNTGRHATGIQFTTDHEILFYTSRSSNNHFPAVSTDGITGDLYPGLTDCFNSFSITQIHRNSGFILGSPCGVRPDLNPAVPVTGKTCRSTDFPGITGRKNPVIQNDIIYIPLTDRIERQCKPVDIKRDGNGRSGTGWVFPKIAGVIPHQPVWQAQYAVCRKFVHIKGKLKRLGNI